MIEPSAVPARGDLPAPPEPRETAIPKLVAAHAGRLFALARGFCGNEEEARDVVQETFLKAWRSWAQFDGRASAGTWLYRIAARTCGAMRRKRAGEPDALLSLEEEGPTDTEAEDAEPGDDLERREGVELMERALAELPDEFRLPLVLQAYLGLSLETVGRVLDLPAATAKTRVHRARARLRAALDLHAADDERPPERFGERVCLDLLTAAARAHERGVAAEFPLDEICRRCADTFAHAAIPAGVCRDLDQPKVLEDLRSRVLARIASAE